MDLTHEMDRSLAVKGPDGLVVWYLLASYAYYQMDVSLLPDSVYDWLCMEILDVMTHHPQAITHRHAHLIDAEALKAGTGFQIKEKEYPRIVVNTATRLAEKVKQ